MTIEELYEIIKEQQEEINDLKCRLTRLKEWSDLNDYYLREMIGSLTENVNELLGITEEEVGGPYHNTEWPFK